MDFQKIIVILSIGILFLCKGTDGVQCYDCLYVKSGNNFQSGLEGCGDSFNQASIPTLTCPGVCSKTRVDLRGILTITRTCLIVTCQESDNHKCCNTALCNAAPGAVSPSVITMLVTSVSAYLMYAFYSR